MNYLPKKDGSKKRCVIYMMLAFILLFSVAVFGQAAVENNNIYSVIESEQPLNNKTESNVAKKEVLSNTSNINFVLWFMGSKQDPNMIILPVGTTGSKQFKTSGMAPNRILIKAFLKKAINFETVVV